MWLRPTRTPYATPLGIKAPLAGLLRALKSASISLNVTHSTPSCVLIHLMKRSIIWSTSGAWGSARPSPC